MAELRKTLKELPWIVQILLVIVYDIYGALIRITTGETKGIVIGVLQLVTGNFFGIMWIIDLVTIIVKKDITVLA